MTLEAPKLCISTPTEPIPSGRGFYQLEEDCLYIQVGPFSNERKFFSYLESENVHLDFDRAGRLIFVEVRVARRHWRVVPDMEPPEIVEAADIRWLDFRDAITEPETLTNHLRAILRLRFREATTPLSYYLAESVIVQVDKGDELASIWVNDIVDDIAGQEIGAFRKNIRRNRSYYA